MCKKIVPWSERGDDGVDAFTSQIRWYAYRRPDQQPGLIRRFIENIKEGFERNKEMQVCSKNVFSQSYQIYVHIVRIISKFEFVFSLSNV